MEAGGIAAANEEISHVAGSLVTGEVGRYLGYIYIAGGLDEHFASKSPVDISIFSTITILKDLQC